MNYEFITEKRQLDAFCDAISQAPAIALDTEFVSEDSYRPDLCLVQVAAGDRLGVIDPRGVPDLAPFWDLVASPGRETLVHAGREEFRFCFEATGKRPHRLMDVQIAAGLAGLDYPAAYGTLVSRLLGVSLPKGETRTDWRRRPLSSRQIEYALQDVVHLGPLSDLLKAKIDQMGRADWLAAELAVWQDRVERFETDERWRHLPGAASLPPRCLAIARELWRWREVEARRQNRPARRVLRDDLIIELARRRTADGKRIRAVRGLEWARTRKAVPALSACIERALALPESECPSPLRRRRRAQFQLLTQLVSAALGCVCRSAQVAPGIVGSADDVRELITYRLGLDRTPAQDPPALAVGWRAEIVGRALDDLLAGKLVLRVADPLAEQPLALEARAADEPEPRED